MLREKYAQEIAAILARYPVKRSAVLPLLYLVQREYGYCTEEGIREVADIVGVSPTQVRGVVGFYSLFYDRPIGRHLIQICDDLPCALRGADELVAHAARRLGVRPGGTTPDGRFTLETVMCIGACHRAPAMQVDLEFVENVTPEVFDQVIADLSRDGT
ncbi:MAG: NADH-quinone oxidoreductase subunit NuoE [Thermoflexus sp.]